MTKIEWTNKVLNLWSGCTKVSEACDNCWAEIMSNRQAGVEISRLRGGIGSQEMRYSPVVNKFGKWNNEINSHFDYKKLMSPLDWKKPQMVFINSMSDTFHKMVPRDDIDMLWTMMALCSNIQPYDKEGEPKGDPYHHTFQILTKRPERMREYLTERTLEEIIENGSELLWGETCGEMQDWAHWNSENKDFLPNVWLGVTAENQERFDERIPTLIKCPARVRFVSVEPMLGPIDNIDSAMTSGVFDFLGDTEPGPGQTYHCGIDLFICGGESGNVARPTHPDWVRKLRDLTTGLDFSKFFFKQWGVWCPGEYKFTDSLNETMHFGGYELQNGAHTLTHQNAYNWDNPEKGLAEGRVISVKLSKKESGHLLDGKVYHEMPEDYEDGP